MRFSVVWAFALAIPITFATAENEWDLLIFTQHWPSTFCVQYEESGDHHVCEKSKLPGAWTIHGVWPTKLGSFGPQYCRDIKFNQSLLNPLHEDLLTFWQNLEHGKADESLWDHEWTKHGTCAISLPALDSEEKYFRAGLELYAKYNMTYILKNGGIVPSPTLEYPVEEFRNVVVKATGANPQIQCIIEKKSKKPYLFEIRICFNKELKVVDCDGVEVGGSPSPLLTNCPAGHLVTYPGSEPSGSSPLLVTSLLMILCTVVQFI